MFNFQDLKTIHLEISTRCQASCPMCPRNYHGGLPNDNLVIEDWSLDSFKRIFDRELLTQINGVYFCGNFGDPIMNSDLPKMCQYLQLNHPSIDLRIHTNGGARSLDWWKSLVDVLPKKHVVVFALDGLEDTHELYRIGTKYEQVIKNAKTFIDAGGIAEWVFIKFKHNEHQVEEAERRSKELGFQRFTVKNSIRFIGETKFSVLDKQGNTIYHLEPASTSHVSLIDADTIKNFKSWLFESRIDCYAKKHGEIYIDAHLNVFPCCFLASTPYNYSDSRSMVSHIRSQILDQYHELVDSLGGISNLHAGTRTVREIIDGDKWQSVWSEYWSDKKLITCARTCGINKNKTISQPKDQFESRINNE